MTSASKRDRANFNQKRKIRNPEDETDLEALAKQVRYTGNPVHKKNPGDFDLHPPAQPRDDKTLCESSGISQRKQALRLLRAGVSRGLISKQTRSGFPQNIWAVTDDGMPLEAELENKGLGTYHGYPVPMADTFREKIIEHWNRE